MASLHRLVGYSSFPYTSSPATDYGQRARDFNWAFKNGRGLKPKNPTFADVLNVIVKSVADCPAFQQPCVLVPLPRSGSSRTSFDPSAPAWPTRELSLCLQRRMGHQVAQLLSRAVPVPRSSDSGSARVSVDEHLNSLAVQSSPALRSARIVLLDDLLVKGTQAMAGFRVLRAAGYSGPIEAYFVHQTIAPNPTPDQRVPFLTHVITWQEGDRLAQRVEVDCWQESEASA